MATSGWAAHQHVRRGQRVVAEEVEGPRLHVGGAGLRLGFGYGFGFGLGLGLELGLGLGLG